MKTKYSVQFLYRVEDGCTGLATLIEQLRYAGLLSVIKETEFTDNPESLTPTTGVNGIYQIHAPAGVDTKIWATQNAARMESFGINARVIGKL